MIRDSDDDNDNDNDGTVVPHFVAPGGHAEVTTRVDLRALWSWSSSFLA